MVLQRLNMDNSWYLQFGGIRWLVDPWLIGAEIDFFSWFNKQWHRTKPIEIGDVPPYDRVLITQKYPDHFHPQTLKALNPKYLIVPSSIQKKVRKVCPQAEVSSFEEVQASSALGICKIHHLPSQRTMDPIYDGLLLEDGQSSVLLATHGYHPSWTPMMKDCPPLKIALTPFDEYLLPAILGGAVSPGMEAVRELISDVSPQYVVATHDEDKHAQGLISRLAKITKAPAHHVLSADPLLKDRLLTIEDYQPITL